MTSSYNTTQSEGHASAARILKEVQLDPRFADTIPGEWALVPIEQDATAQKLERAGFSSKQNDPTLKGWK